MRLLLDTHLLLWAVSTPGKLDVTTRDLVEDPANEVLFSAASIWEIAIKAGLGRADFAVRPDVIAQAARITGFGELPVRAAVAARLLGWCCRGHGGECWRRAIRDHVPDRGVATALLSSVGCSVRLPGAAG